MKFTGKSTEQRSQQRAIENTAKKAAALRFGNA